MVENGDDQIQGSVDTARVHCEGRRTNKNKKKIVLHISYASPKYCTCIVYVCNGYIWKEINESKYYVSNKKIIFIIKIKKNEREREEDKSERENGEGREPWPMRMYP